MVFFDGILKHPFRIYSDKKGKPCCIVSELPLRSDGAFHVAVCLLNWAEKHGVKELAVLDGFKVQKLPKKLKTYCAAEPEKRNKCQQMDIEMVTAGIVGGIAGSILNECLTRKVIGGSYLTPALSFMPDTEGALSLIETEFAL